MSYINLVPFYLYRRITEILYMKKLILMMCAFLCVQCTGKKVANVDDTIGYDFELQEQMSFKEVAYPDLLGSTMQLMKKDSFLFINEFHGDSLIHIFNLKTAQKEGNLVASGNGPNELISPLELQIVDDNLWVLSRQLHLLNHIPFSALDENPVLLKDGLIKSEADCFIPLDENRIVFSGFFRKRYGLMNLNDREVINEFGDYPDFWADEKDFPTEAKAMFHQSRFAINTDKHLFASCSYFVLEIYSYDSKGMDAPELKYRKQLGKYEYDFESGGRVTATMRPGADLVSVDIVSGGEYLYVLIQDEKNRKHRNLMVLDWAGKPIKLLKSGKRITCLAVDEKEGVGYCIIQDPEDKLVSFRL